MFPRHAFFRLNKGVFRVTLSDQCTGSEFEGLILCVVVDLH